MVRPVAVLIGGIAVFLMLGPTPMAHADVAPPPFAPGSDVGPSGETNVRMVSERVLLTISDAVTATNPYSDNASDRMIGRVEATFILRNDGAASESMDVRFPVRRDQYEIAISEGFEASVAGAPAPIVFKDGDGRPFPEATAAASSPNTWATFPGTFPPGVNVEVTVRYDVRPTGYPPFGTFGYVLDTGAAWDGVIGDAEVRVRLPYDVNETNVALNADSMWDTGPLPAGFEVDGTDVVWRFTDLEPTEADNIRLTALIPRLWTDIVAARAAVASQATPTFAAQLALAQSLNAAIGTNKDIGVLTMADSASLVPEADAAYRKAIELAPADAEAHVAYVSFLFYNEVCYVYDCFSPELRRAIDRALVVAPTDERLDDYRSMRAEYGTLVPSWTATAAALPAGDAETTSAAATALGATALAAATASAAAKQEGNERSTATPGGSPGGSAPVDRPAISLSGTSAYLVGLILLLVGVIVGVIVGVTMARPRPTRY